MRQVNYSNTDPSKKLDQLFELFNRGDAPGLVVGVSTGDGFSYRRGFGLASVQHAVTNTPQTRIRIASITKQFTCLALMLLAEDGKIDIDAPVSNYIKGLQEELGKATLRNFMTHSSGYRCTLELGSVANGFAPQPSDWQEQALKRQSSVQFSPGDGQLYCNGTYTALSGVIERVSGTSFTEFLKQRIFEPLAMYGTEVITDDTVMIPGMASAHIRTQGGWKHPEADSELHGDGGMVSNVDDLLRWLAHLRGPKSVGSAQTWQQLLEPFTLESGFKTTYSMGFKHHRYRGLKVIQHSGGLFGLNAQIITVPEHNLDIAIIVNGAAASATELSFRVIDIILEADLSAPPRKQAETVDFEYLLGWHFALPTGLLISFEDIEGALGLSQMNMHPSPVIYEEENSIFVVFEEIGFGPLVWKKADLLSFQRNPGSGLTITIAGKVLQLECIPPVEQTSLKTVGQPTGIFFSKTLAATAEVEKTGENLVMRIKGDYSAKRLFVMKRISKNRFGIVSKNGAERYSVEFDFDEYFNTSGFWIDTHRAHRIRFNRVEETKK